MRSTIAISLCLLTFFYTSAQAPQGLNYQAVARDITGQVVTNKHISLQLTILEGGINGTVRYSETQNVTTNDFGIFTLVIGQGTPASGNNFSNVSWGAGDHYLRIGVDMIGGSNYITTSTTQLMSVPYALYAETAGHYQETDGDSTNELQTITKSGQTVTLSKNGGTILLNDDSPTNELQTLSKTGKALALTQGNTVYLNDDDSTNELQTISKNGNNITLSNNGGTVILFDDDPSNELQSISRSGDSITLSQFGGKVSIKDGDADSTNELQTITKTGNNITLSKGGGTVNVNDADADSTNELQTFSHNGMVATLSKGGGTVLSPDTIVLNYIICIQGAIPGVGGSANVDSAMIGEIKMFAGTFAPNGWQFCQGQILPINQNTDLYAVLGNQFGGNGVTTFALPDLRRRIPVQH